MRADGPTVDIIDAYLRELVPDAAPVLNAPGGDVRARLVDAALVDAGGARIDAVRRDERFGVILTVRVDVPLEGLYVCIWVVNALGIRVLDECLVDDPRHTRALDGTGDHTVSLALPPVLPPGDHVIGAWLGTDDLTLFDGDVAPLRVLARPDDHEELSRRRRAASASVEWRVTGPQP